MIPGIGNSGKHSLATVLFKRDVSPLSILISDRLCSARKINLSLNPPGLEPAPESMETTSNSMSFQMSYMISAWARICKIMGPRFAPYLPLVMGPIMKTASLKPEVALLDNEELGGVEHEGEDWQFVSLGDQQNFGIKTAGTHPSQFPHILQGGVS